MELPGGGNNNGVGRVVRGTRGVRTSVRALRTSLRRERCATTTNNNLIRVAISNGRFMGSIGVGPSTISARSVRVLRSFVAVTFGRTMAGTIARSRARVNTVADNLGLPKVFWL